MGAYELVPIAMLLGVGCSSGTHGQPTDSGSEADGPSDDGELIDADIATGHPLAFSPTDCEPDHSTSVLIVFGLDTGDLRAERLSVSRETGTYATSAEAISSLAFGGPVGQLALAFSQDPLELWEAPANDFGAMAWLDSTTSEIVISGAVVWAGGGTSDASEDAAILIGGPPDPVPSYTIAPNRYWTDAELLTGVAEFGIRSEVVARYTACGTPTIVAYVYTPSVGMTNRSAARGLVLVSGTRASGSEINH